MTLSPTSLTSDSLTPLVDKLWSSLFCSSTMPKRKFIKQHSTPAKTESSDVKAKNLVCSVCKEAFRLESEATNHIVKEHYGLARINDDRPFTDGETTQALIRAQKTLKVLKCKNDGCGRKFKSGLGLKIHWNICGKSTQELNVTCQICGKNLRALSLNGHMKTHATREEIVESIQKLPDIGSGNKRTSALLARKTIKKAVKGEVIICGSLSDAENDEESPENEKTIKPKNVFPVNLDNYYNKILESWKDFVINPKDNERKIPENNDWRLTVEKCGKIRCPLDNCLQEFTTRDGLVYHYKRCGINSKWTCKICNLQAPRGKTSLLKHLLIDHMKSLPPLPSDLLDAANKLISASLIESPSKGNNSSAFNYVIEFYRRHLNQKVFDEWKATLKAWTTLKENELSLYKPKTLFSPKFKLEKSANHWQQLELFESIFSPFNITFFVGGPVTASGWCPTPVSANQADQYLAIATNLEMDSVYTFGQAQPKRGVLQIWNCGLLERVFLDRVTPKLEFCLVHHYGVICDLDWCPGGVAWDDNNFQLPNFEEGTLHRLGLVALACVDGNVRIHSIPHPNLLKRLNSGQPFFRNKPVAVLNPPDLISSETQIAGICKCVSWIKCNNQNLIAGGYGNGIVVVWDLTNRSKILVARQDINQICLRPKISWIAHSAAVTKLKWMYTSSDQFLATCSLDRTAKIWNLTDLAAPLTTFKRGFFTCLDTHIKWCGMFLSSDDCYSNFYSNTLFKDSGFLNFQHNQISSHKSCVWETAISEWLNTEASVDAAGEVVVFCNFKLRNENKFRKGSIVDKLPIYHMSVELLNEVEAKDNLLNDQQVELNFILDRNVKPLRSFEEASLNCGIVFNDFPLDSPNNIPPEELERVRLSTNMQYQRLSDFSIISLTNVKWNCNFSSCTWLFTAGSVGLCRLSCVSYLNPLINR